MDKKKVIDCDNMVVIGYFDEEDTVDTISKYEVAPEWGDVNIDIDGDLCLFRPCDDE